MVYLRNCYFKYLTQNIVKPEESFINSYVNEFLEYESIIFSMRIMHSILDAKHEKSDLNKVTIKNINT